MNPHMHSVPYVKRTVTWFRLTAWGPIELSVAPSYQKEVLMRTKNEHVVTVIIPE